MRQLTQELGSGAHVGLEASWQWMLRKRAAYSKPKEGVLPAGPSGTPGNPPLPEGRSGPGGNRCFSESLLLEQVSEKRTVCPCVCTCVHVCEPHLSVHRLHAFISACV